MAETTTTEVTRAAVRAWFDAFHAGSPDVTGTTVPDVQWVVAQENSPGTREVIPWTGVVITGHDGVRQFFDTLLADFEVLEIVDRKTLVDGDSAAVFGNFRYRNRWTGKIVDSDFAIEILVREGKIARFHFYENTYAVAAASTHTATLDIQNGGRRRTVRVSTPEERHALPSAR
jgi:ketosteroid isomerase-like protein